MWVDSAKETLWFSFELWGLEGEGGCSIFILQAFMPQPLSEEQWKEVGNKLVVLRCHSDLPLGEVRWGN